MWTMTEKISRSPPANALRRPKTGGRVTAANLVVRVREAITNHRLPPGTRLGEEYLCGIFGVGRTIVRQALLQLADESLLVLERGRGASVRQPSEQEARDVFESRRILECALAAKAASVATKADVAKLRAQNQRARAAMEAGAPYPCSLKGTQFFAQFHVMIAEVACNSVLSGLLESLAARTAIIERYFETSMTTACSIDEHAELVRSIEVGKPQTAAQVMGAHLLHIESCLSYPTARSAAVDIDVVLGAVGGQKSSRPQIK